MALLSRKNFNNMYDYEMLLTCIHKATDRNNYSPLQSLLWYMGFRKKKQK